jgi:hypothetical protein
VTVAEMAKQIPSEANLPALVAEIFRLGSAVFCFPGNEIFGLLVIWT